MNREYILQQLAIDEDRLEHFKNTGDQARVDFYTQLIEKHKKDLNADKRITKG